jgi:hypothetical protein
MRYGDDSRRPGPESLPEITGFKIRDNGVGFTDTNMRSFETLDSDLKAALGGRGVGRLLWLKVFQSASIDSVFVADDGRTMRRQFSFTVQNGVSSNKATEAEPDREPGTTVYLQGFDERYRDGSRKTADAIAGALLEHCLWYFVRDGGVARILIKDGEETINLDDAYDEHMHSSASTETMTIKTHVFELTHIKLRSTTKQQHFIGWCASNRLVDEESISGKITGLHGKLEDGDECSSTRAM